MGLDHSLATARNHNPLVHRFKYARMGTCMNHSERPFWGHILTIHRKITLFRRIAKWLDLRITHIDHRPIYFGSLIVRYMSRHNDF